MSEASGVVGENPTVVQQDQTVAYREEFPDVVNSMHRSLNPVDRSIDETVNHSLLNFLERPQSLLSFKWTSAQSPGDLVFSIDDIFMSLVATVQNYNKVQGFRFMKADIELIITLNAQPFQQGGLLLWRIPVNPLDVTWSMYKFNGSLGRQTIRPATGFQSLVYNLMDAGKIRMTIPYVNPNPFIDVVSYPFPSPLGGVYLTVYSSLITGTVEGYLQARFVNVRLVGPTDEALNSSLIPPSLSLRMPPREFAGQRAKFSEDQKDKNRTKYKLEPQTLDRIYDDISRRQTPSQRANGRLPTGGEQAAMSVDTSPPASSSNPSILTNKPISAALTAVASVSGLVATFFPPARIVATPITWLAAAASRVASFLGWSKPMDTSKVSTIRVKTSRYLTNFNGVDTGDVLALDSGNAVVATDLFGTDLDEMMFDHIITNFNYGSFFSWSTSQDTGTVLATYYVSPNVFDDSGYVTSTGAAVITNPTQLGFVANFFSLWNGDISFQFRAFKTNFHSGRLRIRWQPGDTPGATYSDSGSLTYSVIWDLRTQNTTVVTIPYIHERPWIHTMNIYNKLQSPVPNTYNGHIIVEVLNELVATSTVSNTIEIVVELAAKPGFSFAVPKDPGFQPISSLVPQKFVAPTFASLTLEPQVGDDSGIEAEHQYITQKVNDRFPLVSESLCVGEAVVSFRQLLKRLSGYTLNDSTGVHANFQSYKTVDWLTSNPCEFMDLFPQSFIYGQGPSKVFLTAALGPSYYAPRFDLLSQVSVLYTVARGGILAKLMMNVIPLYTPTFALTKYSPIYGYAPPTSCDEFINSAVATSVTNLAIDGLVEVKCPQYTSTPGFLTHCAPDVTSDDYTGGRNRLSVGAFGAQFKTGASSLLPMRAAADDFSFHHLVGVPTLGWAPIGGSSFAP